MWYKIEGNALKAIADAIRAKTGNTDKMTPSDMPGKIEGISPGESISEIDPFLDGTLTVLESKAEKIRKYSCYYLENLSEVKCPNATIVESYVFQNTGIININLDDFASLIEIGDFAFSLSKLISADFPKLQKIGSGAFAFNTNLDTLIIRSDALCSLTNSNAFNSTKIKDGTGYIYVPKSLIEEYKIATNWITYAEQIRAIEDYPEITGGM